MSQSSSSEEDGITQGDAEREVGGRSRLADEDREGFANRIRECIRSGAFSSQEKFADASGLSRQTVQGWLTSNKKRRTGVDAASLVKIARTRGVSLDWLLLGEGQENRNIERSPQTLQHDLRKYLIQGLVDRYSLSVRPMIDEMLPGENELLADVIKQYQPRMSAFIDARRTLVTQQKMERLRMVTDAPQSPWRELTLRSAVQDLEAPITDQEASAPPDERAGSVDEEQWELQVLYRSPEQRKADKRQADFHAREIQLKVALNIVKRIGVGLPSIRWTWNQTPTVTLLLDDRPMVKRQEWRWSSEDQPINNGPLAAKILMFLDSREQVPPNMELMVDRNDETGKSKERL